MSVTLSRTEETMLNADAYTVTDVAGRRPDGLDDVVGATTVTVTRDGTAYRLVGTGARQENVVLFHHKELGSAGEDFLVWAIQDAGDGSLVAQPPFVA